MKSPAPTAVRPYALPLTIREACALRDGLIERAKFLKDKPDDDDPEAAERVWSAVEQLFQLIDHRSAPATLSVKVADLVDGAWSAFRIHHDAAEASFEGLYFDAATVAASLGRARDAATMLEKVRAIPGDRNEVRPFTVAEARASLA